MAKLRYLSLFSGIGGFELAIQSAFPDAECVGYSEIDKNALRVYRHHFPTHLYLGNIKDIDISKLPDFDLLVGGFPCQDLSIAKANRMGLDGDRSGLFWIMLEILRAKQPKWFCFENVASMHPKEKRIITNELRVSPLMINASLVSAQIRKRLFWCNWPLSRPKNRGIILKDILESGESPSDKSYPINATYYKAGTSEACVEYSKLRYQRTLVAIKIPEATKSGYAFAKPGDAVDISYPNSKTRRGRVGNKVKNITTAAQCIGVVSSELNLRKLTITECERLQTFPDKWTSLGTTKSAKRLNSDTQRYKQLGNAVCVEVVKHIMNMLNDYIASGGEPIESGQLELSFL